MFCPKCGSELPQTASFCRVCGSQIRRKSPGTTCDKDIRANADSHKGAIPAAPFPAHNIRSSGGEAFGKALYVFGGVAMGIVSFLWLGKLTAVLQNEVGLLATSFDAAQAALVFSGISVACLLPSIFGALSSAQVVRGFLEGDFHKVARRASRWAWLCFLACVVIMCLCIALNESSGSTLLHVMEHFCKSWLQASVVTTGIASLALLAIAGADALMLRAMNPEEAGSVAL